MTRKRSFDVLGWFAADLPYLAVLWVVYGIFFPGGNMILIGLIPRYLIIYCFATRSMLSFVTAVFLTSTLLYMTPLYISTAPVLVGIRDGSLGDIGAHWGIAVGAAILAVACLAIASLVSRRRQRRDS